MKFLLKLDSLISRTAEKLRQYDFIFLISIFALTLFFLTRFVLMLYSFNSFEFGILNFFGVWVTGLVYDLTFIIYAMTPFILLTSMLPSTFFRKKIFYYLRQTALFGAMFGLWFVMVAEILFWDEFNVRFNFISVDYLIYRQEVTDNIQQSYPMTFIFLLITTLTCGVFYYLRKKLNSNLESPFKIKKRIAVVSALCVLFISVLLFLNQSLKDSFSNSYQSELASNGPYQFVAAFRNNELPYKQFYSSISDLDASHMLKEEVKIKPLDSDNYDIYRNIKFPRARKKFNVFMVMVESLSSDFLKQCGNTEGITPHLDKLIEKSVYFDQLYATGTRTTRGLEAVTLSIPPTPGRSIVKRIGRESGFCSIGNILNENGYNVNFIYGGRGYFDNMNAFFSGNGYGIVDQSSTPSEEISFSNAWGMSDEDLFAQAIKVADESYKKGKLFFSHVMTTSNHRPFTYPANRIDIPSGTGRSGAVKYTDWAIQDLLEKAKEKPWFKNTLFVIIADHQANSAGKVDLPLERYHIPMWFYSPGNLKPKTVDKVCSQIDVAPTILAWLGIDHSAPFFGKDIFSMKPDEERALIGTYQHLGLYKKHTMAVLGPQKKVNIHRNADTRNPKVEDSSINDPLVKLCISYYQSASEIYKNGLNAWSIRESPKKLAKK